MKNYYDLIKNDIELYNCIMKKFWDNVKLELVFKLDNKTFDEIYNYQSIDLKTWQIIYKSDDFTIKSFSRLFYELEYLLKDNLYHLDDIINNHIDKYENM